MIKILIFDDDLDFITSVTRALKKCEIRVVSVHSLQNADSYLKLDTFKETELIVMDACMPGNKPNTMSLIEKIIAMGYKKPIIAASSKEEYSQVLVKAGATHYSTKAGIVGEILKVLEVNG